MLKPVKANNVQNERTLLDTRHTLLKRQIKSWGQHAFEEMPRPVPSRTRNPWTLSFNISGKVKGKPFIKESKIRRL